jgi:hypothetical protein
MVEALRTDLRNVRQLDQLLSLLLRGQRSGVIYEEMAACFLDECDYTVEARWQERFREHYRDAADPVPFKDYDDLRALKGALTQYLGLPPDEQLVEYAHTSAEVGNTFLPEVSQAADQLYSNQVKQSLGGR